MTDAKSSIQLFEPFTNTQNQTGSFRYIGRRKFTSLSRIQEFPYFKWTIPGKDVLKNWYRTVDSVGIKVGLQPIYLRQGFGAWVTKLTEIDLSGSSRLEQVSIPSPLFCFSRLVVRRFLAPGNYEIVGELSF